MIRLANEQDIPQIIDLWKYCFNDSHDFVDFYFNTCFKTFNTVVAEDEGRIQSCLQLLPYRMFLREREIPVSYIVGVATWPEYRGRGLIRHLLQFADNILEERGIFQSILLPFQYDFYRKYGWEICYEFLTYRTIDFSSLPKIDKTAGLKSDKKFIRINKDTCCDKLSLCYNKFVRHFNGYILRGKKEWYKIIHDTVVDGGSCYIYEENGDTKGYIIYSINKEELCINELIYLSKDAKVELMRLALSHLGQVNHVSRKAPPWDLDFLFMKDSRGKLEKETFVMGRIHDIVKALSGIPFSGKDFVIRVNDNFYEKNNGNFLIKQKSGYSYVASTNKEPDVILDIRVLNQLLWGYVSPDITYKEGLIFLKNDCHLENLGQLFPKKYNYLTEEY